MPRRTEANQERRFTQWPRSTPRHIPTPRTQHHDEKPAGIKRWLFTTNHKDIGTLYLVFACVMFFVGGAMAMVIRAELFQPGLQIVDPGFFNTMTTMHALIMIFGAVMPAFVGLANWMIPMQLGAPDMALPRMNNYSFWILPFAFTLLLLTLVTPGGGPAGGWTLYPPLSLQAGDSLPLTIFAIHLMGASSIMGAINIIVTIMNMRMKGMSLLHMPLFVLDLADHGLSADRGHAGARGRGDDAAHRSFLRHHASSAPRAAATR